MVPIHRKPRWMGSFTRGNAKGRPAPRCSGGYFLHSTVNRRKRYFISHSQDHDFGGFNEGGRSLSGFELHLAG